MINTFDFSDLAPMIISLVCYLLAILFWFVWPKTKAKPYSKRISWPGYILHYFHPFAWTLFATAALFQVNQPALTVILALLGGVVYLIFIVMFMKA